MLFLFLKTNNNGGKSFNKTIEIDSDSNDENLCEIINDHQEITGIEVNLLKILIFLWTDF